MTSKQLMLEVRTARTNDGAARLIAAALREVHDTVLHQEQSRWDKLAAIQRSTIAELEAEVAELRRLVREKDRRIAALEYQKEQGDV